MLTQIVAQLVIIFAASVGVFILSRRFRLPAVSGFLVTGVLLGPAGLGVVTDAQGIELMAQVGILLLLFSIGLDLSLGEIGRMRRAFFLGGTLYTALTLLATWGILVSLGWPSAKALFAGFLASLTSTAVPMKLLADRREVRTPHGYLTMGITVFQDFLLVPMLLLTPILAGAEKASGLEILARLAGGFVLVAVIFFVARRVMPRLLDSVVRTGVREVFILGSLAVCLGLALATQAIGLSLATGAFIAGILISESEYSHQVVAEVSPLRDVFNSFFFISIGMLLDREVLHSAWPAVVAVVVGIVGLKAVIGIATAAVAGFAQRVGVLAALALAQIGEFSFVLGVEGSRLGLLDPSENQVFLASAILTLLLSPMLFALGPRLAVAVRWLGLPGGVARVSDPPPPEPQRSDHVVIVGFGVGGRNLARVLRESGLRYCVIEFSGEEVRAAQAGGEPVLFGDATRPEILRRAGLERARALVVAISESAGLRQVVTAARAINTDVHIVVRTRRVADIEELRSLGADEVVAEEFESSLELFARVLAHYHVPRYVVAAQERLLRGDAYRGLRATLAGERLPDAALAALAAGTVDIYRVPDGSRLDGRTVLGLDLRRRTGANLLSLVRDGVPQPNVSEVALAGGDLLVLSGSHQEIDDAFRLLDREGASPRLSDAEDC